MGALLQQLVAFRSQGDIARFEPIMMQEKHVRTVLRHIIDQMFQRQLIEQLTEGRHVHADALGKPRLIDFSRERENPFAAPH